jgi:hypothetical protein
MKMMTRAKAVKALSEAIKSYSGKTGPGKWSVEWYASNSNRAAVGLVYTVEVQNHAFPSPHADIKDSSDILEKFGGNQILKNAGLDYFDGMSDCYVDKFGDRVYCEMSLIEVSDESE